MNFFIVFNSTRKLGKLFLIFGEEYGGGRDRRLFCNRVGRSFLKKVVFLKFIY